MRSVIFVLIILAVAILISAWFESSTPIKSGSKTKESSAIVPTKKVETFETKTDDSGQVFVDVKPLKTGKEDWQFEITITTHSGDLSEDLAEVSKIIVDGVEQAPIKWEGSPPEGHHREGTLSFDGNFVNPKSIKLIIESIGGEKKEFEWSK